MRDTALIFEPIVDIRDVLESYLVSAVLLDDWQATLAAASNHLKELGLAWADLDLIEIGRSAEQLAGKSPAADPVLARATADTVARLLGQIRIPGVPRPDDDDWSF